MASVSAIAQPYAISPSTVEPTQGVEMFTTKKTVRTAAAFVFLMIGILSLSPAGLAAVAGPTEALNRDDINKVQQSLSDKGLYHGRIDGVMGPQTRKAIGEYLGNATNQQAEIHAAYLGLKHLKEPCRVKVYSDSRYVVETMTGNFRKKTNHEWWAKLDKAASKHQIEWQWIKGHAGHEVQDVVDKAARRIAKEGKVDKEMLEEAVLGLGVTEI
jgi:ribonuclease HI